MNKINAAQYLGVSLRTLENYMKANKIPYSFEDSSKSRPVVKFAESDLIAFKENQLVTATPQTVSAPVAATETAIVAAPKPSGVTAAVTANVFAIGGEELRELIDLAGQNRGELVAVENKLLLTIPEAMALSGIKEKPIRDAIKSGDLKSVRVGRSIQVRPTDLSKWVDSLFE